MFLELRVMIKSNGVANINVKEIKMLDIKELTLEHHKNAERQEFVKNSYVCEIDEKLYATYLYNQFQCYAVLEKYGLHNSLFRDTPNLLKARTYTLRLYVFGQI